MRKTWKNDLFSFYYVYRLKSTTYTPVAILLLFYTYVHTTIRRCVQALGKCFEFSSLWNAFSFRVFAPFHVAVQLAHNIYILLFSASTYRLSQSIFDLKDDGKKESSKNGAFNSDCSCSRCEALVFVSEYAVSISTLCFVLSLHKNTASAIRLIVKSIYTNANTFIADGPSNVRAALFVQIKLQFFSIFFVERTKPITHTWNIYTEK